MEILPADFPLASAHVSIAPDVVFRTFATETVILNLQTGRYHGLNKTGGRMLELLERADSVAAALAEFASDYAKEPMEVEPDVRAFCRRLHERGLIEITLNGAR
jgi:hypothetical protein